MTSKSHLSYFERAKAHPNAVAKRLLNIADTKKTNIVLSVDFNNSSDLMRAADALGPYIAVLKVHCNMVSDFNKNTIMGLRAVSEKHNFLVFEDRKLLDVGEPVNESVLPRIYHDGAMKLTMWAHLINASLWGGDSIVGLLAKTAKSEEVRVLGDRGMLIIGDMANAGSTDYYSISCIQAARKHPEFVVGFVAKTKTSLFGNIARVAHIEGEDFIIFTTGVDIASLAPRDAILEGADFLIVGRQALASKDPIATVRAYQQTGWQSYEERVRGTYKEVPLK